MSWKFSILSIESDKNKCLDKEKMAKKKASKKQLAHRKKFSNAVQSCHSSTKSKEAFGKCISKKLKKKSKKK